MFFLGCPGRGLPSVSIRRNALRAAGAHTLMPQSWPRGLNPARPSRCEHAVQGQARPPQAPEINSIIGVLCSFSCDFRRGPVEKNRKGSKMTKTVERKTPAGLSRTGRTPRGQQWPRGCPGVLAQACAAQFLTLRDADWRASCLSLPAVRP